jgi:hypothetical protein
LSAEVIDIWLYRVKTQQEPVHGIDMGKTRSAVNEVFDTSAPGQMGRQRRTRDHSLTDTAFVSYTRDDVIPHMYALFQDRFELGTPKKFVG